VVSNLRTAFADGDQLALGLSPHSGIGYPATRYPSVSLTFP
jgi:hypothetical protein